MYMELAVSGSITSNLWAKTIKNKTGTGIRFVLDVVVMQCHGAVVCIFTALQAAMKV